jgi:5-amino-6-(5-phosphoribosylamino)uracil reductase
VDGYIDDNTEQRLLLSNDEDFDRVDDVRSGVDAILVGANTIRRDNPRLLVRSQPRRERRVAAGSPESPIKVTITGTGDLAPTASFFTAGDVRKIVYTSTDAFAQTSKSVGTVSDVVDAGDPLSLVAVLNDLAQRGVRRLMVEGGGTLHTQFLAAGLANELQLVIAPLFVGDSTAPRFVGDGPFPHKLSHRMELAEVKPIGDVVLLRYLLNGTAHA